MTDQWNSRSGVHDAPVPDADAPAPDAGADSRRRSRGTDGGRPRRPRRSTGDRKIAGVAGGLGRAIGVDPILLRVAFVVLTVFGGFGGLLYVLGWLLLPADGDEVSAAEALLGRGRSSVPLPLAVGLGVVAVISAFSMFSWGLPFLPLAIGGLILVTVLRKRGHLQHRSPHARSDWHGKDWDRSGVAAGSEWTQRTDARVRAFTEQAQRWGEQAQRWGQQNQWRSGSSRFSCPSNRHRDDRFVDQHLDQQYGGSSPFPRPPFWERPTQSADTALSSDTAQSAGDTATPVDLTKPAGTEPHQNMTAGWPGPDGRPRTTPPAWDPLGAAPFAWDLPEPTPLPDPSVRPQGRTILPQLATGVTLLVGAALAGGVFAGWWALTWAQVSGITLAVLAIGLLFSALRGGGRSLIGPGVFLSLVTLALAVTGFSGTAGYGATHITPTYADLQGSYTANAGDLDLDLSGVVIPKGVTRTVDVQLKAGHVHVAVNLSTDVVAVCAADVGRTKCLGEVSDGIGTQSSRTIDGTSDSGQLTLNVTVKAGLAEVADRG